MHLPSTLSDLCLDFEFVWPNLPEISLSLRADGIRAQFSVDCDTCAKMVNHPISNKHTIKSLIIYQQL